MSPDASRSSLLPATTGRGAEEDVPRPNPQNGPPQVDPHGASRWHTSWCLAPDIVVDGTTPHCKTCNRTPNVPAMIINQREEPDLTLPPPDEPYGALNLSWPPGVPYVLSPPTAAPAECQFQHPASPPSCTGLVTRAKARSRARHPSSSMPPTVDFLGSISYNY